MLSQIYLTTPVSELVACLSGTAKEADGVTRVYCLVEIRKFDNAVETEVKNDVTLGLWSRLVTIWYLLRDRRVHHEDLRLYAI